MSSVATGDVRQILPSVTRDEQKYNCISENPVSALISSEEGFDAVCVCLSVLNSIFIQLNCPKVIFALVQHLIFYTSKLDQSSVA